jgi:hypothetical protein
MTARKRYLSIEGSPLPGARERHHLMTMFSMKPKFNLAEFLAEPAKPSASRRRNAFSSKAPKAPVEDEATDEAPAAAAPKPRKP